MSNRDAEPLRQQAMSGAWALGIREGGGLVVRLLGIVILTRLLGPEMFGVFAGPAGIVTLLIFVAQLSQETYLIRKKGELTQRECDTTVTLLLASSASVVSLTLVVLAAFPGIVPDPRSRAVLVVLLLMVPLSTLWAPSQALLERSFQYGKLATLEIAGDVAIYAVAIPGVLLGMSYWAPVAAYLSVTTFRGVGGFVLARYRPSLVFDAQGLKAALSYGSKHVATSWVWTARSSLNAILVGHVLGTSAVGLVAVAIRVVDTLTFFARAAWRISSVAIGRLQEDMGRLGRALTEVLSLQMFAAGFVMAAFALVSPFAIRLVYGPEWTEVVEIVPFFSAAALVSGSGMIASIVLTTLNRMGILALVQYPRLAILVATAPPLMMAMGPPGYACAELLSLSTMILLAVIVRRVAPVRYGYVLVLFFSFAPILFFWSVPGSWRFALFLPALMLSCAPAVRRMHRQTFMTVSSALPLRKAGGGSERTG